MSKEERCNTTLRLGIGVDVKREKQLKQKTTGFRLDLALPVHPKVKVTNHGDCDHKHDEEKYDQDSCSCKTIDDLEEKENRGTKRSDSSNLDVYHDNSDGSRKKLKLTTIQITLLEDRFKIQSTLNTGQKHELAKKLHLLPRQIKVCFQNRRASEENRRLKKELREARCSSKLDFDQQQPQLLPSFYIRYSSKTDADPSVEKWALLFKEAQDSVKKRPLFKIA
ncbi:homeobox-leucine zipper protein HAT22-like protein [Tanacetum coccineum]